MSRIAIKTHIPPAEGQPGLTLTWPIACQPVADDARRRVENWLAEGQQANLWIMLYIGRQMLETDYERTTYEMAFLVRLHQRLKANEAASRASSSH